MMTGIGLAVRSMRLSWGGLPLPPCRRVRVHLRVRQAVTAPRRRLREAAQSYHRGQEGVMVRSSSRMIKCVTITG